MVGGAFDQREGPAFSGSHHPGRALVDHADVLVFETAPLAQAVTLVGDVALVLFIASDRLTMDFTAKLVDVHSPSDSYPQGYAMNLCDGNLSACFRNGFAKAEALVPGEVAELTIRLYPTANRFLQGHRIRIEVASSNFPRFDVNPNVAPGDDLSPSAYPRATPSFSAPVRLRASAGTGWRSKQVGQRQNASPPTREFRWPPNGATLRL